MYLELCWVTGTSMKTKILIMWNYILVEGGNKENKAIHYGKGWLYTVIKEGLSEEVTFELSPEWWQLYEDAWKGMVGRWNDKITGLDIGKNLAYLRNKGSLCGWSIVSKGGVVLDEIEEIMQQRLTPLVMSPSFWLGMWLSGIKTFTGLSQS